MKKNVIISIILLFISISAMSQDSIAVNFAANSKKDSLEISDNSRHKIKIENLDSNFSKQIVIVSSSGITITTISKDSISAAHFKKSYDATNKVLTITMDSLKFISPFKINCNGKFPILIQYGNSNLITIKTRQSNTPSVDSGTPSFPFVDSNMLKSISGSYQCTVCNDTLLIQKRRERKFSTDYIITFDASRKKHDYTICKHIIRRKDSNQLIERYKILRALRFSPVVGSQVKFQVVNIPLTQFAKIVVNDGDLFIDNSAIQSVLTAQLNATLLKNLNTPTDSSAKKGSVNNQRPETQSKVLSESIDVKLNRLAGELQTYVNSFNLSPCTINDNRNNSLIIRSRIFQQFQLKSPANALNELVEKFSGNDSQKALATTIKDLIVFLDSLSPLVYTTPRLANRDFVNIKVINGRNETIADQNIRPSLGLKIDYSTGVFLTGLRDQSFIFKDTSLSYSHKVNDSITQSRDTSGSFLRQQNSGKINVGFGVLAHFYPRISGNYNIGLTTGFMTTPSLDLNVLLGGSVMFQSLFGTNHRISLSGGMVWGKVKRLSTEYFEGFRRVDETNTAKPVFFARTGDPTVSVWQRSWFFGITYNLR
jgi:hypothetical protein